VAFPVLYERLQFLDGFDALFAGNGVVGPGKNGRCRFDAAGDVFTSALVQVTLVAQLLSLISTISEAPGRMCHTESRSGYFVSRWNGFNKNDVSKVGDSTICRISGDPPVSLSLSNSRMAICSHFFWLAMYGS
jgi:hypothetical protein